ncbi:MAG: GDSL-type esterase/lipase family protein [Oscillospiraceae bacterium]
MQQRVKRQTKLKKTPLFVLLGMILIVICIIVAIFIGFMKADISSQSSNLLSLVETSSNASSQVSSGTSSTVSSEIPPSSNTQVQATKEVQVKIVVPETVPVGDDYFKDALFIGDSISKGLKVYGVVPESNVLADQNVGLDQIYNNKDVYYISAKVKTTLWKAIEKKIPNPKKIYVLLGSNGIPGYENDYHMKFYNDLVDKLKAKYPDAIIYIQSVTPITKNSEYIRKTFSTAKINDLNKMILKMAEDKSVYHLNIEQILKDKNGYLKAEYAATDGIHLKKEGHAAVYKYYKNHTVTKEGMATIIDKDPNKGE